MILNFTQRTAPLRPEPGETVLDLRGLHERFGRSKLDFFRLIRRRGQDRCVAVILDHRTHQRTFFIKLLALLVPAKTRAIVDLHGREEPIRAGRFFTEDLAAFVADGVCSVRVLAGVLRRLADLGRPVTERTATRERSDDVYYLRSGLVVGYTAGGSAGHVTGVATGLIRRGHAVTVFSSEALPFLAQTGVQTRVIPAGRRFRDFPEIRSMNFAGVYAEAIALHGRGRAAPRFVYQRLSLNDVSGAVVARRLGVPLVLEYNGSDVWASLHWGNDRLTFAAISTRLEDAAFRCADLIVVVSDVLKDELVGRAVPAEKVLVNPNGVDPEAYSPERFDAGEIAAERERLGFPAGAVVVGFIGTFSPWHGVDVLARAIPEVAGRCANARFLLIGDGPLREGLRAQVAEAGAESAVCFTGLVPQAEAPRLLACCDLFVSPQVDNPDGSRFFGSPTKLFEYMAFGRGIVASRAGQIGQILEDGKTAVLVGPGDARDLARGIVELVEDRGRRDALGRAAREAVLARHTWDHHVRRIIERVEAIEES